MLKRKLILSIGAIGLLMVFGSLLRAQPNETILTIALDEAQMDIINEQTLQGFYESHPGVKVVNVALKRDRTSYYGLDPANASNSLDQAERFFSSADIVIANQYNMNPLITSAKYVLDLAPYVRADSSGDIDDFYPVARKIFEWDNGLWALPMAVRANFISYDAAAFDAAGHPYPDALWGLNDYLDAGQALTLYDDNGNVLTPGFYGFEERLLLGGLLGLKFYDSNTQPETPFLNDPQMAAAIEALQSYNEALLGDDPDNMLAQTWDFNKIPMQMTGAWSLYETNPHPYTLSLFPNETAVVTGEGFAISAGTSYPDLAYELIMYLSGNIDVVTRYFSDAPARRSLSGQTARDFSIAPPPKALADILPNILENGIPVSEMRYGEYLSLVHSKMMADKTLSTEEAIEQVQQQAIDDIALAQARQTTKLSVEPPVSTPAFSSDKVVLKFLLQSNFSPLPNREIWKRVSEEFSALDPEVGSVELITNSTNLQRDYRVADCAYTSSNSVPWIDVSLIQPIDPFLATDSTFDRSDLPDGIWPSVMRDDMIYGLPLTVSPIMMWYNPRTFEASGILSPQNDWTVSDFLNVLKSLKEAQPTVIPYSSQNYGNTFYILLSAALGGVPVDYSTYIPTYHLTDTAVIEALRQTLDLARDGYIDYTELSGGQGGHGISPQTALYDSSGAVYNWGDLGTDYNPYVPLTFPRGTDTIPLAYNVGTGLVTSHTLYADACYRWLSTLSQHPELFNEMPARRSLATSQDIIATRGRAAFDFYVSLFDMLDSPQSILVVASGEGNSSSGASIADIWFNKALDAYVLENRDLEIVLTDAQKLIEEYSACISSIPPFDAALGYDGARWKSYYKQFTDCAISVDPSLESRFELQDE